MSQLRTVLLTGVAVLACGVLATATGGVDAQAPPPIAPEAALPGEWMYPRSSRDVLAAVRATIAAAGLTLQHDERDFGAVVTKSAPYDEARWLAASALNLPPGHTPTAVQFHIHVSPDLEPARIAVAAVLDTASVQTPLTGAKAKGSTRFYAWRPLAASFMSALSARLGVEAEPLTATHAARAAQAARLLPPGLAGGCGVKAPVPLGPGSVVEREPRKTRYAVMPLYPDEQQRRGAGGRIEIAADLTEHGTVAGMATNSDQVGDENLRAAAFGAAGLWRYRSAVVGGCPVAVKVIVGVQFTMSR